MMIDHHKIVSLVVAAVGTLAVALYLLWPIHFCSETASHDSDSQQWRQPASLSERYPELISTRHWQFDYAPIEHALRTIKTNQEGGLFLNASTAKSLENAVSGMPNNMKQESLDRVEWLINKSFSQAFSQSLSTLLVNFYQYHQASYIASVASSNNDSEHSTLNQARQLRERIQRQEYYLGKGVAEQLFGRQNAVSRYLYARKRINDNSSLTSAEKQQLLSDLQHRFKEHDK